MTDYEYDPDLPYVVECHGEMDARFRTYEAAELFTAAEYRETHAAEIIDTTPKPRVPEDAKFITWRDDDDRWYAERSDVEGRWDDSEGGHGWILEDLPGVTPDTEFTVLEERKSDE